jgi:hypothetical protein
MSYPGQDRPVLVELRRAMEMSRHRVGALRFPLAAAAVVMIVAAAWCLVAGRRHLLIFYGPALLLAIAASSHHFNARAEREGLRLPIRAWAWSAVGLMGISAAVARLGSATGAERVEIAGPSLVFALGYFALGVWGHNRALLWCCTAMVAASLALGTVLSGDRAVAAQLTAYGALLLLAAWRSREATDA